MSGEAPERRRTVRLIRCGPARPPRSRSRVRGYDGDAVTDTFRAFGEWYDYLDHPYNNTRKNERCIEVPIARRWIEQHRPMGVGDGLEVGNVLSHYGPVSHRVVDRWEEGDHDRHDVFEIEGPYPWCVSISTLEHVRRDEPGFTNRYGSIAALYYLRGLAARLLVTVPLGYDAALDTFLVTNDVDAARCATFVCEAGEWRQTDDLEWRAFSAMTREGGAVWIGE